jgi:hypothetical protein
VRYWNPSRTKFEPAPGPGFKRAFWLPVAYAADAAAIWEESGVGVFLTVMEFLQELVRIAAKERPALPLIGVSATRVIQFAKGSSTVPVLKSLRFVSRPACLPETRSEAPQVTTGASAPQLTAPAASPQAMPAPALAPAPGAALWPPKAAIAPAPLAAPASTTLAAPVVGGWDAAAPPEQSKLPAAEPKAAAPPKRGRAAKQTQQAVPQHDAELDDSIEF